MKINSTLALVMGLSVAQYNVWASQGTDTIKLINKSEKAFFVKHSYSLSLLKSANHTTVIGDKVDYTQYISPTHGKLTFYEIVATQRLDWRDTEGIMKELLGGPRKKDTPTYVIELPKDSPQSIELYASNYHLVFDAAQSR